MKLLKNKIILLMSIGFMFSQTHFQTVYEGNPYLAMNIYITSIEFENYELLPGDEIGVFDGNVCVGVLQLDESYNFPFQIIASADDPTTSDIDGFVNGNQIQFKLWLNNFQIEITELQIEWQSGESQFYPQETSVLSMLINYGFIEGCTDSSADNYDINASNDDGTCEFTPIEIDNIPELENYSSTVDIIIPEIILEEIELNIELPAGALDIEEGVEVSLEISEASEGELQNIIDDSVSSDADIEVFEGVTFFATDEYGNPIDLTEGSMIDVEITFEPDRNSYNLGYITENGELVSLGSNCIDNGDGSFTCGGEGPGFGIYIIYSFDPTLVIEGCIDLLACENYNPDANVSDGSCIYEDECGICGGTGPLENYDCEGHFYFTHELGYGNNLISFPGVLENNSTVNLLEGIMDDNGPNILFLLGQGVGLFNTVDGWSGNLNFVNSHSGYWINIQGSYDLDIDFISAVTQCENYETGYGNNLMSYKWGEGSSPTLDALGGESFASDNFNFILGQGVGLFNTADGWSGNLNTLHEGIGYWLNITNSSLEFKWGFDNCENSENYPPLLKETQVHQIPSIFNVIQSTQQAFYLLKEINIDGLIPKVDDLVLAYNGNVLIGSTEYTGRFTALPVMGRDMSDQTVGFLEDGQVPILKLYKSTTGEIIDLQADLEPFSNLLVSEVQTVTGSTIVIPNEYALHPAYPNPFNPVTNIKFAVPENALISVIIYDINGRVIEVLADGMVNAGFHNLTWDSGKNPSGLYFVKLDALGFSDTQKLMLVK